MLLQEGTLAPPSWSQWSEPDYSWNAWMVLDNGIAIMRFLWKPYAPRRDAASARIDYGQYHSRPAIGTSNKVCSRRPSKRISGRKRWRRQQRSSNDI